ncbi:hypothetical protein JKP10_21320 [Vibrio vulnificus]|uniref:hypothetical protein n=2 Tax=Vibrio TaxID=662 RepID=UPI001CDB596F|nr:hypothetical protein [Vibrio vulnificus]MCA4002040.1 hypothetical protein [Vibrio vulnificus]MCA4010922.1 hypothetical protein [Vibrio vulnificus]MDK2609348.1 hypothetical protein [Vibrio vulnificus]MDK2612493.1 hypothetical protein [Vibrio vulnificus]MDK2628266.1 hypothetical protein [Vibrio vulnificus]
MFKNEAEMQQRIAEYAHRFGGLSELIEEHDYEAGNSLEEDLIIESYNYCLESLYETELISENENISLFDKQILKPDFLLFDPGYEKFIIVELKNSKGPTREAGTELGAYSNVIKTHFPMIADSDIAFVVISSDWPTLLKNYLFNEIFWHKRKILCLEPVAQEGSSFRLQCLNPKALFEQNVKTTFSNKSFSGMQYCIYGSGIYSGDPIEKLDDNIFQIKASFERIIRKSQQHNSHGFAFLWKDFRKGSLARYNVTLVDINPFEKYQGSIINLENRFTEKLFNCLSEHEVSGMTGTTIDSMRSGGYFLENIASPIPEGFLPWGELKKIMLQNCELISFKSWGVVADLYDEFLCDLYLTSNVDYEYDNPGLGIKFTESIIR